MDVDRVLGARLRLGVRMCIASRRAKNHASGIGALCDEKHVTKGATLESSIDKDIFLFLN